MVPLVRVAHVVRAGLDATPMLGGRFAGAGSDVVPCRLSANADDWEFAECLRQQPVLLLVPFGRALCPSPARERSGSRGKHDAMIDHVAASLQLAPSPPMTENERSHL